MIKKFDEFIKEGFLSKTLGRSKSGEERLEDKIDSNIDSLDEIDLGFPFVIADIDFELGNGTNAFTWYEVVSYLDYIHSKGWRLMEFDEIRRYIVGNKKTIDILHNKGCVDIKDKKTQDFVRFRFDRSLDSCSFNWWIDYSKSGHPRSEPENSSYANTFHNNSYSHPTLGIKQKTELAQLRLVKDKNVNEGFLSKTLGRSKSGEERLEDKINSNVNEFKEVDLGLPFVFADIDLIVDGENKFTYDEVKEHLTHLKSTGWRLPKYDELLNTDVFDESKMKYDVKHSGKNSFRTVSATSLLTHETLTFDDLSPVYGGFWLLDYEDDLVDIDEIKIKKEKQIRVWYVGGKTLDRFEIGGRQHKQRIRLVKDKK